MNEIDRKKENCREREMIEKERNILFEKQLVC